MPYDVVGERAEVRDTFMQEMVKQVESMDAAAKDSQEKLNVVKKIPNHKALFRDMLPVIELRTQALVHLLGSVPQHHCRRRGQRPEAGPEGHMTTGPRGDRGHVTVPPRRHLRFELFGLWMAAR